MTVLRLRSLIRLLSAVLVFTLMFPSWAQGQQPIITTVAGGGPSGIPAIEANLWDPAAICADQNDNLFILTRRRVFRLDAGTGLISPYAGTGVDGPFGDNGPAVAAHLFGPQGMAMDSVGNLYIADSTNQRIRKVEAATGIISTVAGNGAAGFSGDGGPALNATLNFPGSLTVDASGNIFLADLNNRRVRRVDAATGLINTVAGNGVPGYSGDGGLATLASLSGFFGVYVDSSGNLYIADRDNQRVRMVDSSTNIIHTVAGNGVAASLGDGGSAGAASVWGPIAVVTDGTGSLYIAEQNGNRIRRVQSGIISTFAGTGVQGFSGDGGPASLAQLSRPSGLTLDSGANLIVADINNRRVRKVEITTGLIATVAGNGSAGFSGDGYTAILGSLLVPGGVVADADGNLYIADRGNHRIRKVEAATGLISTLAGNGIGGFSGDSGFATAAQLREPNELALDAAGNLFILDRGNQRIRRVDAGTQVITTVAGTGTTGFSGDGGPATSANLSSPGGIVVDTSGSLVIADTVNHRIRRVDSVTQTIQTIAGTGQQGFNGDGTALATQLSAPFGIAIDPQGNLVFSDIGNHRIRRVDTQTGMVETIAGNGTASFSGDGALALNGAFNQPFGVKVNTHGDVYVADLNNRRVRKIVGDTGILTTVVGSGTRGFAGDGGPATDAWLFNPIGLALDGAGNLYVADESTDRIRKVTFPAPAVTFEPATLVFGEQALGTSSLISTPLPTEFEMFLFAPYFDVYNAGSDVLVISSVSPTGDFSIVGPDDCSGRSLGPGESCRLFLAFAPTAMGMLTGELMVMSNAAGSPHTAALSGLGVAGVPTTVTITAPGTAIAGQDFGTLFTVSSADGIPTGQGQFQMECIGSFPVLDLNNGQTGASLQCDEFQTGTRHINFYYLGQGKYLPSDGVTTIEILPADADGDGVPDATDNCPHVANPDQTDSDGDGVGDTCDNCLVIYNPDQADTDNDGIGDACEDDGNVCTLPGGGVLDCDDGNPFTDDTCDPLAGCSHILRDSDGDGVPDENDNCISAPNTDQADSDGDTLGNACDPFPNDPANDADGDGIGANADNCPLVANTGQADSDGDGLGNACDPFPNDPANDADGDGIGANADNCPLVANADQTDSDNDGVGNACDATPFPVLTKFLYTPDFYSGTISGFTVDYLTGNLTSTGPPLAVGGNPHGVDATPDGRFLYLADYGQGRLKGFAIDEATGGLTPLPGVNIFTGAEARSVTVNAAGTVLYITNGGSNNVRAFSIDGGTGALTEIAGSPFATGGYAYNLTFHPSGNFAYVVNRYSNNIAAFAVNNSTGALTPVPGSPFPTGGGEPIQVAVTPDGQFAYVANRTSNQVAVFTIDQATGALATTSGSGVPAGNNPQFLAMDPAGKFLHLSNSIGGNSVSVYTINSSTGDLAEVVGSSFATGQHPLGMTLNPSGNLLYVAALDSNQMWIHTVDPSSGALTPLAGSPNATGTGPVVVELTGGYGDPAATPQALSILPANPSVAFGGAQQFIASATYSDGTTRFVTTSATWDSSDMAVATISSTPGTAGLATSLGVGTTSVTANFAGLIASTTLNVTGTPAASFSASSLNFGNQRVGTTSAAQGVTLSNTGNAPLHIGGVFTAGVFAGDYSQSNDCGASLAPGNSCIIQVTFTPLATGPRPAEFFVSNDAPGPPHHPIGLNGLGVVPVASILVTDIDFGDQRVGTAGTAQSITLSNTGDAPMLIGNIEVKDAIPIDFLTSNDCGASLEPGALCTVQVAFAPTAPGATAAEVRILSDAAGSPHTVTVTGFGTAPVAVLSPANLNFGNLRVGTSTASQFVSLQNLGDADLLIGSLSLSGANVSDFAQTNDCPAILEPSDNCTIAVSFVPSAPGARAAQLNLTSDAGGSPHNAGLAGFGTAPVVSLASTLAFPLQQVGKTSAVQNVQLANIGDAPLLISSITITGEFAQSNNCGFQLAPLASCTLGVTFRPLSVGTRTGTLTVTDDATGSPHTVSLSGIGSALTVAPSSLVFPTQLVGTSSAAKKVTITNKGLSAIALTGITLSGPFVITSSTCAASLPAGASCDVFLSFSPTSKVAASGTLTVTSTDPGSPHQVALSGTATIVNVIPNKLNFPPRNVGTTSPPKQVTVTNVSTTEALLVTAMPISGPNSGDYAATSPCGVLAPGASCVINVTFKPLGTGARSATLEIHHDGGGSPFSVILNGTGR